MKAVFKFDQGTVEVSHSPEDEKEPYVFLKIENPTSAYTSICIHLDPDDARLIADALTRTAKVAES